MSQSGDNPTLQRVTLGLGECTPHLLMPSPLHYCRFSKTKQLLRCVPQFFNYSIIFFFKFKLMGPFITVLQTLSELCFVSYPVSS